MIGDSNRLFGLDRKHVAQVQNSTPAGVFVGQASVENNVVIGAFSNRVGGFIIDGPIDAWHLCQRSELLWACIQVTHQNDIIFSRRKIFEFSNPLENAMHHRQLLLHFVRVSVNIDQRERERTNVGWNSRYKASDQRFAMQ